MMRIIAAIAAIVVAGSLFMGAGYVAGAAFSCRLQHPTLVRYLGFAAPFVAVAISIGVAITASSAGTIRKL